MNTTSPDDLQLEASSNARKKRKVLFAIVALFAVQGLLFGLIPGETEQKVLGFVAGIAFAALVLSWCALDRAERNLTPWRGFTFFVVLFPTALVMVPLYLCATRGWKGIASIALAALFFVGLCLIGGTVAGLVSLVTSESVSQPSGSR